MTSFRLITRGIALITSASTAERQPSLWPPEIQVMAEGGGGGESRGGDVVEKLDSRLAYTTVMTTLDRLFKKGLLDRYKSERAFVYTPRLSSDDWERQRAGDLVAGILSGSQPSR